MANVIFEDFTIRVQETIAQNAVAALEEAAGELETQVKRNQTRVDTGKTKNSWRHIVDESTLTAHVGSPDENAIWEEFGTGEYALNGDGRKGGWRYQNAKGDWYYTRGKKPIRALWNAYNSKKNTIKTIIQNRMKGL